MIKPNKIIEINTTLEDFFKRWLIFLKPYHQMSGKQIDIAAEFLYKRYEFSKVISDETILNQHINSSVTRNEIRDKFGCNYQYFQAILGNLKEHQFFVDNKINPKFIPNISDDQNCFSLFFLFNIKKDEPEKNEENTAE